MCVEWGKRLGDFEGGLQGRERMRGEVRGGEGGGTFLHGLRARGNWIFA